MGASKSIVELLMLFKTGFIINKLPPSFQLPLLLILKTIVFTIPIVAWSFTINAAVR